MKSRIVKVIRRLSYTGDGIRVDGIRKQPPSFRGYEYVAYYEDGFARTIMVSTMRKPWVHYSPDQEIAKRGEEGSLRRHCKLSDEPLYRARPKPQKLLIFPVEDLEA